MEDAAAALKQMNRTLIGSVLFIDIVNYSMSTVPDQLAMKEAFIDLLVEAIQNVAPADRIMVDTGDGAGIAFLGDPEDALFTALTLRDAIESGQVTVGEPGFVRMGINLGRVKDVDIKTVNELFLMTQPAHLQKLLGRKMDGDVRRAARADFIRKRLGGAA